MNRRRQSGVAGRRPMVGFLLGLLGLLTIPVCSHGYELQPLATRDLAPLVIVFGLPSLGPAQVLGKHRGRVQGTLDLVSNFTFGDNSDESLLLDGETHRFALSADYGIGQGFELGAELPLVNHQGGFLDDFIEGWHDFFGMPQGGRDQSADGRLEYRYARNGGDGFQLNESTTALGDLSLRGGWQWWRDEKRGRALALRVNLKLPTGDVARLSGSGGTDLALWLSGEQRWRGTNGGWLLYGGGGLLAGEGDLLSDQRRNLVGLINLGLGWQPLPALGLQLQFDGHSPFFRESSLKELSDFAGQLAIGGSCALREGTVLELAVTEDIFVATVPDVAFHFALRQQF